MCGITGIMAFNLVGKFNKVHITQATMSMEKRGPDFQDIYIDAWVGLGHRRLSVIDTSENANQPMWDRTGRYCLVYNGEIFNFPELKKGLDAKGVAFRSHSDTEVLLELFISQKEQCLSQLNGFFAFCIYDKQDQSLFLARDRFGVKPLLYLFDEDKFIFASDMKAMLQYGIDKQLDYTSLITYLQLNYIPAPDTILRQVKKLLPGQCITLADKKLRVESWYQIPFDQHSAETNPMSYAEAKRQFSGLLEEAVRQRLVADVPIGAFLSGGIDSSVVTGLASRHQSHLHTFSIGFRDEKYFDETAYAKLVASHFKTEHTVFSLTNSDLYEHVADILHAMTEPFADSSAINVYILSKETRRHATVALSGDGADELLAGYHKHEALHRMLQPGLKEKAIAAFGPLWKALPHSRNNKLTNLFRQADRFAEGFRLSPPARYWRWATFADLNDVTGLLTSKAAEAFVAQEFYHRQQTILRSLPSGHDLNNILLTDMQLVLPNDMLMKSDSMSMAHGLEIRSPFLDYNLVNFVFTLPARFKLEGTRRKIILQDAFRDMLPEKLYNRPKKGFEVPLLKWFRKEMKSLIFDDLLSREYIEAQGLFRPAAIEKLRQKLFSNNPGDVHARIWALIVFQWWFRKYMG